MMSAKVLFRWLCIISVIGVAILLLIVTLPVQAQCENPQPSSCFTCHAQEDPVNEKGEWHVIHADKDICINCHGGNGSAMDKDLAHESLMAYPLDDIYTDCHGCHPDYNERAARFAPTLGVTPGSCATPTPFPISKIPGEPPSSRINLPTDVIGAAPAPHPFLMIGVGLAILTIFIFGLGWLERNHGRN